MRIEYKFITIYSYLIVTCFLCGCKERESTKEKAQNNNVIKKHLSLTKLTEEKFIDEVKKVISQGKDINKPLDIKGYRRYSPLIISLIERFDKAIIFLIDNGADINTPTKDGLTPLFLAVSHNQIEVVKAFIKHGADPNLKDKKYNVTPLDSAIRLGHVNMVKLLINSGADLGIESLGTAVGWENAEIIKIILENGADVNYVNKDGNTMLHHAVHWSNNKEIVQILLEHGAEVNAKNNDGLTPLHYAQYNLNHKEMIVLLRKYGAFDEDIEEKIN